MLSISPPAKGTARAKYYMDLAREDYYLAGGEPLGKWFGEGAKYLGLDGRTVERFQFHSLLKGYAPHTGEALVQNAGNENRQGLWDLTFSAPKSVSVAWSQASEDIRQEIQIAHEGAVKAALTQLEELFGWTRRGKEGETMEPTHLISALFEHGTSRAQDPQLHTHALLFNLGVREDLSTGSIFVRPVFVAKMALGALYRAELALNLERLGFTCERGSQETFELKGRNLGLCSFFSKRSREIRSEMNRLGIFGALAAQKVTLGTRTTKEHHPREKLFGIWREVGKRFGWTKEQLRKSQARRREPGQVIQEKKEILERAMERLTHSVTHFSQIALIRAVAEEAQTRGVGAKESVKICREAIKSEEIKPLGNGLFSTKKCLEMEKDLLSRVEESKTDKAHILNARTVDKALKGKKTLSEEQKAAVRHITVGEGSIAVVNGMAGTGKSTLLEVARKLWEKEGYTVHGAAFTGKAARELETGSGIKSRTIAKTQILLDASGAIYWGKKAIAPKAPQWSPFHGVTVPCLRLGKENLVLTKKSILVIDEAGMVPTPQMKDLLDRAAKAKAKVVLVGDAKQLQAIEQGGAFSAIAKRLGAATLTEIKRQTQAWGRDLVKTFADGNAAQALEKAKELGLLNVTKNQAAAKTKLISDWKRQGAQKPEENLILAGTRADAAELNKLAQEERIKMRKLGSRSHKTEAERIYEGDRILFTQNSTRFGVQNGTLATVEKIDRTFLWAKLDGGETVQIPLQSYKHFQLGYAVTTHKAQGMTTQNAFVLLDSKMQDLHLSYVQVSRARRATSLYVDQKTAGDKLSSLIKAMSQSREKKLATDLMEDFKKEDKEDQERKLEEEKQRRQREAEERERERSKAQSQSQSLSH